MGSKLLRRAARAGLVGGVAVIYLALVGMVEKFEARHLVSDWLNLGRLMLASAPLLAGYLATRPRVQAGQIVRLSRGPAVAAGLVSGVLTGGLAALWLAFVHLFPDDAVRNIFVAVSPTLLSIMTFGKSLLAGGLLLVVAGTVLGALGGAYQTLPERLRRPLSIGLATTFLFALLQRIIPPLIFYLNLDSTWLYSTSFGGLTPIGVVVVFVVATGLPALWAARGQLVRQRVAQLSPARRRALNVSRLLLLAIVLTLLPRLIGSTLSQVLGQIGIFLLMGLGLNIVVGYAGLLDLGYVAFFAAGAYLTALFTGGHLVTSLGAVASPAFLLHLDFYLAVPLVILFAAFIGLLIGAPVLRLRGDYLAIVTLGFGEIARVLLASGWLQKFTGGPQGLRDITDAHIGSVGFRDPQPFYYLVLAFCALAIFVSVRLADSRVGRAWSAMREDELAAEAMGISTVRYKLLAFAMGAAVGCLSGTLFAVQIGSLTPDSFTILVSITALAVVVLGGMGSIRGVIVGTMLLIGLPGLLDEFEEYRLLVYGAALITVMVLRPQGLIPNVRRMHELQEEDVAQDQWLKEQAPAVTAAGGGGGS